MNWFKSLFSKKERLVKTFKVDVTMKSTREQGIVWIHLFESESGKRRIDGVTNIGGAKIDCTRFDIYNDKIYRWLKGARDPDISSYAESKQDDTMAFLKGKV